MFSLKEKLQEPFLSSHIFGTSQDNAGKARVACCWKEAIYPWLHLMKFHPWRVWSWWSSLLNPVPLRDAVLLRGLTLGLMYLGRREISSSVKLFLSSHLCFLNKLRPAGLLSVSRHPLTERGGSPAKCRAKAQLCPSFLLWYGKYLEIAFTKKHQLISWAQKTSKHRMKAWHLCLHFGFISFTLSQISAQLYTLRWFQRGICLPHLSQSSPRVKAQREVIVLDQCHLGFL